MCVAIGTRIGIGLAQFDITASVGERVFETDLCITGRFAGLQLPQCEEGFQKLFHDGTVVSGHMRCAGNVWVISPIAAANATAMTRNV